MEVAAEIYTRVIFPDSASKSDLHLSHLQKTMLDATPDCIKVLSVDGRLLTMNRAGCVALDVPENSGFGMPWLPLLPEETHPLGLAALHEAAAGRPGRFPGKSISPGGTLFWDNLLTPVVDESGRVLSILCVSREVTTQTLLEKRLEDVIDRERLLSREMQHRIKNLFSVVSGLILIAEKEARAAACPESSTQILREKLGALARASDAAFEHANPDVGGAVASDLEAVVRSVLKPYGDNCLVAGSTVSIRRSAMTTLALFLHELATNSVKYGAFSKDGRVAIRWIVSDDTLHLTWTETEGPPVPAAPGRSGFGSEMVNRIVQAAGGAIDRAWHPDGLVVDLRLPKSISG